MAGFGNLGGAGNQKQKGVKVGLHKTDQVLLDSGRRLILPRPSSIDMPSAFLLPLWPLEVLLASWRAAGGVCRAMLLVAHYTLQHAKVAKRSGGCGFPNTQALIAAIAAGGARKRNVERDPDETHSPAPLSRIRNTSAPMLASDHSDLQVPST